MRKSFTRLFSLCMLLSLFCISAVLGAAPQFQSAISIPKHGANNLKPADVTSFVVAFDKAISLTASGGTFSIYSGTSQLLKTITIPSASVKLGTDGKSLVINPGIALSPGEYHLSLTAGTVKDADNVTNAAITEGAGWHFVVGDFVAPTLVAGSNFTPKDDVTHFQAVGGTTPFTLVFNEPVAAGTGNIVLYRADGVVVDMVPAAAADYSVANKVSVTFAPTGGYNDLTGYYVKIEAGAIVDDRAELDIDGVALNPAVKNRNKFGGVNDNTTYNFSTKDFSAPVIGAASVSPAGQSASLNVSLNEVGKVKYVVRLSSAGVPTASDVLNAAGVNVASGTVNVTAANTSFAANMAGLSTDTEYKVYLATTVTYAASPEYTLNGTEVTTKTFKTTDGAAPSIISALDNTARANNDDKKTVGVKIRFNEEVVPGSGVVTIRRSSDNFGYLTVDASSLTVKKIADANYEVTVPFATALESDVQYYVVMPQGIVKDKQGNLSAELTQLSGFFITGSDYTVPQVESVKFSSDPTTLNDNIVISFNEQLVSSAIVGGAIAANNLSIAFENNNVPVNATIAYAPAGNKSTITITPAAPLSPNTTYAVKVRPGVFKDDNSNTISVELPYTLTTRDLGPSTVAYSVTNTAGVIAKDAKYKVTFEKLPKVVSGTTTVAATNENLAALVTLQKVASPNVNIPFALSFGLNNDGKYEAVITPSANLESDIQVVFDMDESKLKDSQGTVFTAATIANMTVQDWKAPTATMKRSGNIYPTYPAFAIEFNEAMYKDGVALTNAQDVSSLNSLKLTDANGVNVAFTAAYSTADPAKPAIVFTASLELGKTYYYGIGASLSDAAGNKIAAASATFTYNDTQVVKASATSPAKGATGVVLTGTGNNELAVSVTFDQVVSTVLGSTAATRTAYLIPVGNNTIAGAIASHEIVDADLVGSTLSFKFTGLTDVVFNAAASKWYVHIPAGGIKSSVNPSLLFGGFPLTTANGAGDAWPAMYFAAKDIAKPVATFTAPAGAVALDANLGYTFNEEVVKAGGNILIKDGGTTVLTIDVNSASVELASNGQSVVIKHSALPKYSTNYTVEIPVSAFKDKAGNELAGVVTGTFTTVANILPTVAQFTPASLSAPGSDGVALASNLIIKFSEPVDKVTGKLVTLYKWDTSLDPDNWVLVENILAENTSVSAEIVTINPSADLLANTKYAVKIEAGAYKDKSLPTAGDYAGISDFTTWAFSTKNELAPAATFTFVKRSDEKVEIGSNIVITFNKPIEKLDGSAIVNSDIPAIFTLKKSDNTVLTFTGIISDDKMTVTLNGTSFSPALASSAVYEISVVGGVLRGTANNQTIGTLSASFTVSDYTKPVATEPSFAEVTDSKMKVTLASNENGKIFYLFQAGDGNTAAPSAATIMAGSSVDVSGASVTKEFTGLTSQTSYVIFAVATDAMGNVSDVVKKVQATTDVTGPVVLTKSSNFHKTDKTIELTFNEAVTVSGNAVIYDKATQVQLGQVALSVVAGTDGKKVTTAAWAGMPLVAQELYVEVENATIKDASNNKFAGLYNQAWVVTTADQTAPGAPGVKPTDNSGIKLDQVFTLEFNEDVKLVDPMPVAAVVITEEGNNYEIVANVTASGKVVTIDPERNFRESKSYTLTIQPNTISDLAGNKFAGTVTKTFTTLDATPASIAWSPDGSVSVPKTTTVLTITFDQPIQQLNGTGIESFDLDSLVTLTTTASAVPAHSQSISVDNKVITITIPEGLKSGTSYTYGFKAKFKGADGVAIPAQTKTFQTTQSTESITILPAENDDNNTTRIPVTVNQTFTLSANVPFYTWSNVASGNNLAVTATYAKTAIKLYPGGQLTGEIDMKVEVSADGRTISLTPASDLNSTANYDLVILPNLIQLGTANSTAVNIANVKVEYVTADVAKPVVDAAADASPFTDGYAPKITGEVGKTDAMKLTFNENVMSGAGSIEIRRQDGVLVKTVDASAITYDNKVATILSDMSELPVNQLYYVIIPSGVITDKSGNPYAGISSITAWTFTLKDDVTPQATFTPNNVTGVAVTNDLKLMFDRAVTANTTGWIAVYKADGNAVELIKPAAFGSKVSFSADGLTATIDINQLDQNTTYNVEIGAGAMKSTTGVAFAGVEKSLWSFSTEDNSGPEVVEFTPADKASIELWENTLSVKFNKNIAKGTGKIYVRKANGDLLQEFDVTSSDVKVVDDVLSFDVTGLATSSNYYVIMDNTAVTNTSSTPEKFAGLLTPTAWTFSTKADVEVPSATYAPNGDLAVDLVPSEVELTMTFTEPIVCGSGSLVIYDAVADTVVETIEIVPSMIEGKVVTVVPTELAEVMSYYVQVAEGVVKDLAGNLYAGISDETSWVFSTGDFAGPELVSWTPKNETTEHNHPLFKMTFNEDVKLGTGGNMKVYKVGTTTVVLDIPITAAMVNGKEVTVTYTTLKGLDKSTDYYVKVDGSALTDNAGNAFAGVTDATTWTFKTGPDFATLVEPNASLEFKVYPNPFVDFVNVVYASKLSKVVVTNIAGQAVKEVVNPSNRIQLNELRSGVYFISLYDMDNVIAKTAKIVKR